MPTADLPPTRRAERRRPTGLRRRDGERPADPRPRRLRLLRRVGVVDPESLDDYRAHGGYAALRRAVELGPTRVITEVTDSALTGRGGAAFPTGVKWDGVARAPERPHYLVCNADESEPGTFKDRVLMESDPFGLVEAMTIAGYATGCERGYLYIRGEYPLATRRLQHAIEAARARGYLGDDVMGAGFAFDIELRRGAGAYICGEETALLNSIEGFRGEPRNKPPFPSVSGPVRPAHGDQQRGDALQRPGGPRRRRARVRRDRRRALHRVEAVLRLRRGRTCRASTRCDVRHHAARAARPRGRASAASCGRSCSAAPPAGS